MPKSRSKPILLKPFSLLAILIGLSTLIFTFISYSRHVSLHTQLNDLGNIEQPLINSLRGRFMELTNNPYVTSYTQNRFGGHSNYILLFILPLYALFPSTLLLLFLQSSLICLGALPLYFLSQRLIKNSKISLLIAFLYLLNPFVQDAIIFDFHPEIFIIPLLITAYYFFHFHTRFTLIPICFILLLKEDTALVTLFFGLYFLFFSQSKRLSSQIILVSFVFLMINLGFLMPYFRGFQTSSLVERRYDYLGHDLPTVFINIFSKPHLWLNHLFTTRNFSLFFLLLSSVGFVPLNQISLLFLTLPTFAINMLSTNPITTTFFGYYYCAPIIAVFCLTLPIFFAKHHQPKYIFIITTICLGFSYFFSPLPYSPYVTFAHYLPTTHTRIFHNQVLPLIPQTATVSAQNNLGPHLVNRQSIIAFPHKILESDYVIIDITDLYPKVQTFPRQYNFPFLTSLVLVEYQKAVESIFASGNYQVIFYKDGYFVFHKQPVFDNQPAYQDFSQRISSLSSRYQHYQQNYYSLP